MRRGRRRLGLRVEPLDRAGRASGADADWHLAIIYTMRDGLVVRGDEYLGRGEALEVAGFSRE